MAEDGSRKRTLNSPSEHTSSTSSKHTCTEERLATASTRQNAEQSSTCDQSDMPMEPEEVQFFVKSLSGETLVVREPLTARLDDLKCSVLQRWSHGKSSRLSEGAVFLTCEGKHLEEWKTLKDLPVRSGSTLEMRVRLLSTRVGGPPAVARRCASFRSCRTVANDGAMLQELAKKMVQGQRTDEMVETFLSTLNCYLLLEKDFAAEDRVAAFVGTGGLQAITSLLGSTSSFVALNSVQLVCKHLTDAVREDGSLLAILTGWHLLDALLDQCSDAARSDGALSNYVCDLFNRLCGPSALQSTFVRLTLDQNVRFTAVFAKLARRLGALIQRDASCVGQGQPLPVPEFPSLKEVSSVLERLQSVREDEQYEKCHEALFAELSAAVVPLLGGAIEAAQHRDYARQIVASALDFTRRASPVSRSSTLRGLPAKFFQHVAGCLRALVKLAGGRSPLESLLLALLEEHSATVEDLLAVNEPGLFVASKQLRCVFEPPYRDLWPLQVKENCLRDFLPVSDPGWGHRVDVRRGPDALADAFSGIEAGFHAHTLKLGINASFQNEAGLGPGVTREFFTVVSRELFNPVFALFRASPADRTRLFPDLNSGVNPGHLSYFRFCGRFIALAIAHRMPLGITFCSALTHELLRRSGESPRSQNVGHFAARDIDPELFAACERVLRMPASQVELLGLTFVYTTERLGGHTEQELCPGGPEREVTAENRAEFVRLKIRKQLLEPVGPQIAALREGLQSLLEHDGEKWPDAFGILTEEEFDALLHGSTADLSIDDWEEHTTYHGYTADHPVIQNFWQAVRSLDPEQQRNLLFFTTAVRYLPSTGFAGLSDSFHIHHTDSGPESLPRAHTCYFQLVLPAYGSYELMEQRLMTVVQRHVMEGFGDV